MSKGNPRCAPLGEVLVGRSIITNDQLKMALEEQKTNNRPLLRTLVKLGFATEEEVIPVLGRQRAVPWVNLENTRVEPCVIEMVPPKYAHHYRLIPIELANGFLAVAIANPFDINVSDELKLLLGCDVKLVLAGENDIEEGLKRYYGIGAETVEKMIDQATTVEESEAPRVTIEDIEEIADEASIIRFVNQILLEAFKERATDVHIEPFEDELRIRYRIDGILYDVAVPPDIKHFHSTIVSRVKIMSSLNIAEKRLPQDGRIKIKVGGEELDLRISILPTQFGETVDIRLLSNKMLLSLDKLGLLPQDLAIFESTVKKPHGIILVTGPTGSGKTTTLYACLTKIRSSKKKIITVEDPIEYQLRGITQIQVHPKIGMTFSQGLRHMLRHDPDIMMVGEIRDHETAEIAIQVALTGHLVFSTVHTNNAASTITRLINMGTEPYLVSSSVECIIAQRLVRLICPHCKTEVSIDKSIVEQFEGDSDSGGMRSFEGRGCSACKFTGHKGRTAIYEILTLNDEIRELIMKMTPAHRINERAKDFGMRTLRQDGWEKVKMGLTTVSEVLRVTQDEGSGG